MGGWVCPRESHQDVKGPTGPRGRLAALSEVRQGPLPTTGARGGDRGLAGDSAEEVRLDKAGEPGAQRSGRR